MAQKLPKNLQSLPEYTEAEVRDAAGERCIVVLYDIVCDLTDFLYEHPGGAEVIYEHSGMDITTIFEDVGHSQDSRTMMLPYVIGRLASSEKQTSLHPLNATLSAISSFIRG